VFRLETTIFHSVYVAIDSVSALVIVGYCAAAFLTAVRLRRPMEAGALVAKGALLGMSIKLVATCLKTIELQTWNQIAVFLAIFALRVILKRIFQAEDKLGPQTEPVSR